MHAAATMTAKDIYTSTGQRARLRVASVQVAHTSVDVIDERSASVPRPHLTTYRNMKF